MHTTRIPMYFFFIILLSGNCTRQAAFNFYGKWQSLNDQGLVIEIHKNGSYTLFRNDVPPFTTPAKLYTFKIRITKEEADWYSFSTDQKNNKGRIEVVSKDRIRIYFHKHHDILDVADEFYRTENFTSFEAIMARIQQEPETEIQ